MTADLVAQQIALGRVIFGHEGETLIPSTKVDTTYLLRQEVEQRGEKGRLTGIRRLGHHEYRCLSLDRQPEKGRGAGIQQTGVNEPRDRQRIRWLMAISPPAIGLLWWIDRLRVQLAEGLAIQRSVRHSPIYLPRARDAGRSVSALSHSLHPIVALPPDRRSRGDGHWERPISGL